MVPAAAATLATPEPADDVQVTSFMGSSEPATTPRQRATNVSAQPPPATAQTFERQSWNAQVYTPPRLETAEVVEPAPRAPPPPLQAQPTGVKNTTPLVSVKRQIPIQVDYKSLNPRPTSSYANMDQNQNHNNSLLNNKKNMSYSKSLTNLLADDDEKDESCSDNDKSKSRSGNLLDEENYAAKSPTKRFERGTVRTQVKTTYHKQHHIVKKFGSNNELSTTEELANDKHETYDSDTTEFTEESFYKDIYGPNLTTTTTTTSQPTSKIITESYV